MSPGENIQRCSRSCAPWWGTCGKQGGVPVSALGLHPPEAHYKDSVASIVVVVVVFFCTAIPGNAGRGAGSESRERGKPVVQGWGGVGLALAEQRPAVNRAQSHQKPLEGAWDTLQPGG